MDTLNIEKLNKTVDTILTVTNDIAKQIQPSPTFCCDLEIIIFLILLTGIIGGIVNYLSVKDINEQGWKSFIYNILLGIIGANLIPLFLKLTDSKLLESCGQCNTIYLVLSGYMLIASIFSKRLIGILGKKIFNIDDIKKEIDKAQTEPTAKDDLPEKEVEDIENQIKSKSSSTDKSGKELTDDQKKNAIDNTNKILSNMQGSRYKFRTLSGIVKSTQLDENEVTIILNIFKSKRIIEEISREGETYYKLTERGQTLRLLKV